MMSFSQLPKSYYEKVYGPAIEAAGLKPIRADDIFLPSPIISDIWREVRTARLLVADLTFRSPNVMYELGLAHALGKPVVMLTQSIADVPFDLQNYRAIVYQPVEPDWAETTRAILTKTLKEVLKAPTKYVLPVFLQERDVRDQPTVGPTEKRLAELERDVEVLQDRIQTRMRIGSAPVSVWPSTVAYPFLNLESPLTPFTLRSTAQPLVPNLTDVTRLIVPSIGAPDELQSKPRKNT